MKKFLVLLLIVAPMSLFAQKFGYINSVEIVQVMPEYIKAQNDYQTLQKQYADEYDRLRAEFEKKGAPGGKYPYSLSHPLPSAGNRPECDFLRLRSSPVV